MKTKISSLLAHLKFGFVLLQWEDNGVWNPEILSPYILFTFTCSLTLTVVALSRVSFTHTTLVKLLLLFFYIRPENRAALLVVNVKLMLPRAVLHCIICLAVWNKGRRYISTLTKQASCLCDRCIFKMSHKYTHQIIWRVCDSSTHKVCCSSVRTADQWWVRHSNWWFQLLLWPTSVLAVLAAPFKLFMYINFRWSLSDWFCFTLPLSSSGGGEYQRSGAGASRASLPWLPEDCQETGGHPRPAGATAPSAISHKHP